MFQCHPLQQFHRNKRSAIFVPDLVDSANVGMAKRRSSLSLPPEAGQCVRVMSNFFGEEFERDEPVQLGIFSFVNDTHTSAPYFFENAVVRDGLADHWAEILGRQVGQVNEG